MANSQNGFGDRGNAGKEKKGDIRNTKQAAWALQTKINQTKQKNVDSKI